MEGNLPHSGIRIRIGQKYINFLLLSPWTQDAKIIPWLRITISEKVNFG